MEVQFYQHHSKEENQVPLKSRKVAKQNRKIRKNNKPKPKAHEPASNHSNSRSNRYKYKYSPDYLESESSQAFGLRLYSSE